MAIPAPSITLQKYCHRGQKGVRYILVLSKRMMIVRENMLTSVYPRDWVGTLPA